MMRKIAVLVLSGLLLAGLLAVPASAQDGYVPDVIRPRIIERVEPPAEPPPAVPPAVQPRPLAVTGLDVTVGMVLAGLLILSGGGLVLVARRQRRSAPA